MGARRAMIAAALLATTACAQYLVMAPEPRYSGQPHSKNISSVLYGTGASPHPGVVAAECGADQLAMVRLTRDFGQWFLTTLTLGAYAPATVHYYCARPPQPPGGTIDTGVEIGG
jgi:hypothetical protein